MKKTIKLTTLALFLILAVPFAFALNAPINTAEVNGNIAWDGVLGEATINYNEPLNIRVIAATFSQPLKISGKIIDANGKTVHTYYDNKIADGTSFNEVWGFRNHNDAGDYTSRAGTYSLVITISDKVETKNYVVNVNVVGEPPKTENHPPVLNPIEDKTVYAGKSLIFNLVATDEDKDTLVYYISTPYALAYKGILNRNTGALSWAPTEADVGAYDVTFNVADGKGGVASKTAKITVKKNSAPVIHNTASLVNAYEGQQFTLQIDADDVDEGQTITYTAYGLPEGISINSATGVISYNTINGVIPIPFTKVSHPKRFDDYDVSVAVFDGEIAKLYSFKLRINDVNRKPSFTLLPAPQTVKEGSEISFQIKAVDNDAEDVSKLVLETSNAKLKPYLSKVSDGIWQFKWTPSAGDSKNSPYPLSISLSDGIDSAIAQVRIIVEAKTVVETENNAPVANFTITPKEDIKVGTAVTFDASSSTDAENDELIYSWYFGDGTTASGVKATHSFSKAETFNVKLTVKEKSTVEKYSDDEIKTVSVESIVTHENQAPHFAEKEKTINLKELEHLVFEVVAVDEDTPQPTDVRHTTGDAKNNYLQYSLVDTNIPVPKDQLKWNFFFSDRNKYVVSWKTTLKDSGSYFFKFRVYDPLSNKEDFMTLHFNVEDFDILKVKSWIGLSHDQREVNDGDSIDVYENNLLNVMADVRGPDGKEILFTEKNDPITVSIISPASILKQNSYDDRWYQWTPDYDTVSAPLTQRAFNNIILKVNYQGVDFTRTFNVNVKDGNRGPDVIILSPVDGSNIAENSNSQLKAGITKTDREINKDNIRLTVKDKNSPQNVLLNEFIGQFCAGDSSNYECNYNIPVKDNWPQNLRIELWAADTSGFLGVDFVDVNSVAKPTPKLEITKMELFNPVVEGHEQSISFEVKADGQKVDGSNVAVFFDDGTKFGECVTGVNDAFNGGCAARRVMDDNGTFKIFALAAKPGFVLSDKKHAEFDVFEEGYIIEELNSYGDSSYSTGKNDFYRGETLYVKFRVKDKFTGQYATDTTASATLDNKFTGQKLQLHNEGLDGIYYRFKVQIPADHKFKGETQVFTFAINFADKKGGEEVITITIKNNNPAILQIPDLVCELGKQQSCDFDLTNYGSDKEDAKELLKWRAFPQSDAVIANLFDAAIVNERTLRITPKNEGEGSVILNAIDLDNDQASGSANVIITKSAVQPSNLEITSLQCFENVVAGERQSCTAKVESNGQPVAGANVELFFSDGTSFGQKGITQPITGAYETKHTMNREGTFTVYAIANKEGFIGDNDKQPSFTFSVLRHRYDITDLKVYSDAAFTPTSEDYNFFRGENMYVQFRVIDLDNNNQFVDSIVTKATLVSPPGGREDLTPMAQSGLFYRYALTPIPLSHEFKGESQVFTFAFNFADGSGGQKEVNLIINNNPPSISGVPDITCRVGEICAPLPLSQYINDREDNKNLALSIVGANGNLFTATISNQNLIITPISAGTDEITLTAADLDMDTASDNILVTILPQIIITTQKSRLTFGVSSGSGTVTANYVEDGQSRTQSTSSQITINADRNTQVTLTASPSTNYVFSSWSTGLASSGISFAITQDTSMFASFSQLIITNPNRAPVITSSPATNAAADEPYSYDVEAYDPDGDAIVYELVSKPEGMAINQNTGLITWEPRIKQAGDYAVTVRVSETSTQDRLSTVQSYTLHVEEVPHSLRNDLISIDYISIPSNLEGYSGGDYIPVEISFTNNGRISLRNVIANVALIDDYSDEPSYPMRISFDASAGETVTKRIYVELPDDLKNEKEYYISVTSSNVNTRGSVEGPLVFW